MINLDNRSRDILLLLLRSEKPLVARDIASLLGISPRMVRYNLLQVEPWLKDRNVSLDCRANYGALIISTPKIKNELILEIERLDDDSNLSPDERLRAVILFLLTETEPVLVKQLELRLCVSRPTVLRDLREAELWLGEHNLTVTSRPNFGTQVTGREQDRREAIVSLLLESSGKELMLSLCTGPGVQLPLRSPGESGPLREYLQNLNLFFTKSLVDAAVAKLQIKISDNAYISLVLYLSLMIKRTQLGQKIEFLQENLLGLSAEKELQVTRIIAKQIQSHYNVILDESEMAFIAAQLLAVSETVDPQDTKPVDPRVWKIAEDMIAESSIYLHPCLRIDQQLIDNLVKHLSPVLIQLQIGLLIRNPLLEHIKRQYPYYYQVAQKSSVILKAKTGLNVPDDEIGFIALHLGAAMERLRSQPGKKKRVLIVCIEGVATAWLLVSKIRAELPDIEVVNVSSLQELRRSKTPKFDIDAIVTTIPLEMSNIPVITVNPLLGFEDISRLREALRMDLTPVIKQPERFPSGGEISLSSLITTDTIRLKVSAKSWVDVVDVASEPLTAAGAITPDYVEAMKSVIEKYGPYAVTWPGIVLLHARPEDGVRRLCMSLTTLKTPVNFGHPENDPVDIALVLGTVDSNSHLRALLELTELLADEISLNRIRHSSNRQEVEEVVRHFTSERS